MRLLFISTTSAESIAISVPDPIAIPVLAVVSAGASFMPSPTIVTLPCFLSSVITFAFSSGRTSAITSLTPVCAFIAFAVRSLSPVSIITRIPIPESSAIAFVLSGFIVSATAIMPITSPFFAKNSGVFPSFARRSDTVFCSSESIAEDSINFWFPPIICEPLSSAVSPFPETSLKFSVSSAVNCCFFASSTIASASGCKLFISSEYAVFKSSFSVMPNGITSVTFGVPLVIVPVLSSTTISVLPAFSSVVAFLNSMPFFAPTPFPTIIATGVASPNAHGQLITRTEMARASAKPTVSPAISQITRVTTAIAITTGTKMPETLSAAFATGAFVADASLTIRIICEISVSSLTLIASHFINPDTFIAAALTSSPTALSTGMLSPVSADSLTAQCPSMIRPSAGMLSPVRTMNISPFLISDISTVTSTPSRSITAVLGVSFFNPSSALVVLPFDRASSILPTVMSTKIIAADSK